MTFNSVSLKQEVKPQFMWLSFSNPKFTHFKFIGFTLNLKSFHWINVVLETADTAVHRIVVNTAEKATVW